jgi:murein DD-endopeptidase MepM/ murein hydrolase activator NlpD
LEKGEWVMRWAASLFLAFAVCGSACGQEMQRSGVQSDAKGDFGEVFGLVRSGTAEELTEECQAAFWEELLKNAKSNTKPELNIENISACNIQKQNALTCTGVTQQGGAVLCQTEPNAKVKIARSEKDFYYESADENGQIIIGFDRDETKNFVEVSGERVTFDLTNRDYDTSRIDGLPPSQVSTFTEAQLKRIRSSSARKKIGFSSRAKEMGFRNGFISPIKEYRKTTNFGAQRILNGEPKKPHYGVDLAAPVGTPIYAPADGVVSLADDDLYFEGAMVLLDHGQGLISMYLHVNDILVEPGQRVSQGEQIATVGSKGRSTGPHLCWRLKWRNRNLDPELLTEWPQEG